MSAKCRSAMDSSFGLTRRMTLLSEAAGLAKNRTFGSSAALSGVSPVIAMKMNTTLRIRRYFSVGPTKVATRQRAAGSKILSAHGQRRRAFRSGAARTVPARNCKTYTANILFVLLDAASSIATCLMAKPTAACHTYGLS